MRVALVAWVMWSAMVAAQPCERQCPQEARDARGCCPPAWLSPVACHGDVRCAQSARGCAQGNAEACDAYASFFEPGNPAGIAADGARVIAAAERACELGPPHGCERLARRLRRGDGAPRDYARAHTVSQRACEHGDYAACLSVGVDLHWGRGVARDRATELAAYRAAFEGTSQRCEEGRARGSLWSSILCAGAARILAFGRVGPADAERARQYYLWSAEIARQECARGSRFCRSAWTAALEAGQRDVALEMLRHGCAVGPMHHCRDLGLVGPSGDVEVARRALGTACAAGNADACHYLPTLEAEAGHDVSRAVAAYEAACRVEQTRHCPVSVRESAPPAGVCREAMDIAVNSTVPGTLQGPSMMGSLCGWGATGPERVFRLRLARRTRVRLEAASLADVIVSVRRSCEDLGSELACNDDDPVHDQLLDERRAAVTVDLERGTWFIVVDSFGRDAAGDFELSVNAAR